MTGALTGATRTEPAPEEEPAPSVECDRPPHRSSVPIDLEVERAALGAAVLNRTAAEHVAAVRLDDWTSPERRAVAAAIRDLLDDDGAPDPVLVAHHAGVTLETVHHLFATTPAVSQARRYCEIVSEFGWRRRVVQRCAELTEAVWERLDDERISELLAGLRKEIEDQP